LLDSDALKSNKNILQRFVDDDIEYKIKCGIGNYEPLYRVGSSGKDISITQKNRYTDKALFFITTAPLLLIYLFLIISNYLRKNNLANIYVGKVF
jgi:hypothetical protein